MTDSSAPRKTTYPMASVSLYRLPIGQNTTGTIASARPGSRRSRAPSATRFGCAATWARYAGPVRTASMTTRLSTMPTVPMMYSTPIQAAAFRSALMPGLPGAAAIVRFVFTLHLLSLERILGATRPGSEGVCRSGEPAAGYGLSRRGLSKLVQGGLPDQLHGLDEAVTHPD